MSLAFYYRTKITLDRTLDESDFHFTDDETSEEDADEGDEDSNAEDNWRNDYPDDEDGGYSSDDL